MMNAMSSGDFISSYALVFMYVYVFVVLRVGH